MNGARRRTQVCGVSVVLPSVAVAGVAAVALLLSTCYWQPSGSDAAGNLSVHVQLPAPPMVTQHSNSGNLHAQNYTGTAEFALFLFPSEVFQGPSGYTVFAYLMGDDPDDAWKANLSPYATAIHHVPNYTVGSSGSVSFTNLPAGRSYTILGWCWADIENGNGGDYYEAMDLASVTIIAGQNQTVSLSLGDNYPKFIMAMLDFGVPIARFFQADGAAQSSMQIAGNSFEPGGVGIELVRILQDGSQNFVGFLHHLYIVETGSSFDFTKRHNPAVTGSDRVVRNNKKFVELALATEEPLLFEDWVEYIQSEVWPLEISSMMPGQLPYVERARAWTGTQTLSGTPAAEAHLVTLSATETTNTVSVDFEEFVGSVVYDPYSVYLPTWVPPELLTGIRLRVNTADISGDYVFAQDFQYYQLLDANAYAAGSPPQFWWSPSSADFNNWYGHEAIVILNAAGIEISKTESRSLLPDPEDVGEGIWEFEIMGLAPDREWRLLITTWEAGDAPPEIFNGAALSLAVLATGQEQPTVELDQMGYETTAIYFS